MKKTLGYGLPGLGLIILIAFSHAHDSSSRISSPAASTPPTSAHGTPPSPASTNWEYQIGSPDLMDHDVIEALIAHSDVNHSDLMVVCHSKNKPEILFTLDGAQPEPELGLYNEHTVKIRFDEAAPRVELWTPATNNHALYTEHPKLLVKSLTKAGDFYFQYQQFEGGNVTTHFKVSGLQDILKQHQACQTLLKQ